MAFMAAAPVAAGLSAGEGAALAGGIGALGNIGGGLLGMFGQQSANAMSAQQFAQAQQFNAQEAATNRDFQLMMATTAYQHTMDDMRKAGLNPILAANLGAGAAGAGGAQASISGASNFGNAMGSLGGGLSAAAGAPATAAAVKVALQQADKDKSQTNLNEAAETLTNQQTNKTAQEERTSKAAEDLTRAQIGRVASGIASDMATANSANANARVATRVAEDTEKFGDSPLSKAVGGILRMLKTGADTGGPTAPRQTEKVWEWGPLSIERYKR